MEEADNKVTEPKKKRTSSFLDKLKKKRGASSGAAKQSEHIADNNKAPAEIAPVQ